VPHSLAIQSCANLHIESRRWPPSRRQSTRAGPRWLEKEAETEEGRPDWPKDWPRFSWALKGSGELVQAELSVRHTVHRRQSTEDSLPHSVCGFSQRQTPDQIGHQRQTAVEEPPFPATSPLQFLPISTDFRAKTAGGQSPKRKGAPAEFPAGKNGPIGP